MASIPFIGMWDGSFQHGLFCTWRCVRAVGLVYLVGCTIYFASLLKALSTPLPEVKIPMVVGVDRERAIADLEKLGLIVHADTSEPADGFPAGGVMYQSLSPDSHVREGRNIYLIICQGPAHVTLPDFRQAANYDAIRALAQLGLQPSIASTAHSATIPFDGVIEQIPAPGTRVEVGSPVALIVSDGPPDDMYGGDSSGYDAGTTGGDTGAGTRERRPKSDAAKGSTTGKGKDAASGGAGGPTTPATDPSLPNIPMPNLNASPGTDPSLTTAGTTGSIPPIPGDTTSQPGAGDPGPYLAPMHSGSQGSHRHGRPGHTAPPIPRQSPAVPRPDQIPVESPHLSDPGPLPMPPEGSGQKP